MNFTKTKQFEEEVFAVNKEILIRFMGGGNVISTDYLSGELAVFDIMGIDKVFSVSVVNIELLLYGCVKTIGLTSP